jgi:hypothetical protein
MLVAARVAKWVRPTYPYSSVFIDCDRRGLFLLPLAGEGDKPTVSLFRDGG